jgi:type I restriction enzyme M protein
VKTEQVAAHAFALTPGRYVGTAAADHDQEPFEDAFADLKSKLSHLFEEGQALDKEIAKQLARLG